MFGSDSFLWRRPSPIWAYGAALLSVVSAALISHWPLLHLGSSPVSLLLCAVMFSAWLGGIVPGLLAILLSALVFYHNFLPPVHALVSKPEQIPRFLVFLVSAFFVGILSAAQRSAMESLRRAHGRLNETVQELKNTNAALTKSEAYLADAQTLTETGSFAWNLATGEQSWSAEIFRIYEYDSALKPTFQAVLERVHPDDRDLVQKASQSAMRGEEFDFEHRLLMPGGSIKKLHVRGHALYRETSNPEFVGAVMDITAMKNAMEEIQALRDQLYKENLALREEIDISRMFEEIVGSSPPLQAVLSSVAKVAPTDSTVLVTGETGTGKELVARAIHKRSQRASRAFVSVNCAIIPRDLIASELFGHERGAFTGATQRRLGRFESAEGGTIFLDEVGELPLETQIALLRVLQEREFQRVGANQLVRADVRVVAATNRDLRAAIAEGKFREDLFYRLNVFPVEVPPLRERREDIALLVEYFVDRFASKAGKKITGIGKKSMEVLQAYSWPGNIRELQNVIERSVIVCESENLSVDEGWLERIAPAPDSGSQRLSERLAAQERQIIEAALAETNGRVSGPRGAAARLGMPQSTLDSKIRSLKIDKYRFRKT
jgi:DNA-binding NtrC family response regulator